MDEELVDGVGEEIPDVGDDGMAEDPIAGQADSSQQERTPREKRVDLTELPEWRQAQASYDRRIHELSSRLQEYETRLEEQSLAGMDDYERADYQAKKLAQQNQRLQQELMRTQAEAAKREGLKAISEKYKVPVDQLDDSSPDAAEASALRYLLEQTKKAQAAEQQRETRQRNNVDVGGGQPRSREVRNRARFNQLKKQGTAVDLYKEALRQQREAGR